MYVVDASVWVSRSVEGDVHHRPSREWIGRMVNRREPLVAPALLLAELSGAVARRTAISELGLKASSYVQSLSNVYLMPVDKELAELSATIAAQLRLRGTDAIYVAAAKRLGVPLVTLDQEQLERAHGAVEVVGVG